MHARITITDLSGHTMQVTRGAQVLFTNSLAIGTGITDRENGILCPDISRVVMDSGGNSHRVALMHFHLILAHTIQDTATKDMKHFIAVRVEMARIFLAWLNDRLADRHCVGILELF